MILLLTSSLLYMATATDLTSMMTKNFDPKNFEDMRQQVQMAWDQENFSQIKDINFELFPIYANNVNYNNMRFQKEKLKKEDEKKIQKQCKFYKSQFYICSPKITLKLPTSGCDIQISFGNYFIDMHDKGVYLNVMPDTSKDMKKIPLTLMQDNKRFHLRWAIMIDNIGTLRCRYLGHPRHWINDDTFGNYICGLSKQDIDEKTKRLLKNFTLLAKHYLKKPYKYNLPHKN